MLVVTVIKSTLQCNTCTETEIIVNSVVANYPGRVTCQVLIDGSPEAQQFGIVTTPVLAIGNKIYAMGKPVIKAKVENWLKKELGD